MWMMDALVGLAVYRSEGKHRSRGVRLFAECLMAKSSRDEASSARCAPVPQCAQPKHLIGANESVLLLSQRRPPVER